LSVGANPTADGINRVMLRRLLLEDEDDDEHEDEDPNFGV